MREEILSFWWLDNGGLFLSRSSNLSGEEGSLYIGLAISDRLTPFCTQAVLPLQGSGTTASWFEHPLERYYLLSAAQVPPTILRVTR